MITVIFTCHKRPSLTELCLRRLIELMPQPYELLICYDGDDVDYVIDLIEVVCTSIPYTMHYHIYNNNETESRFGLINRALEDARGDMFMHVENDFYWADPTCLDAALNAFHRYPDLDYIRFEHLPFTQRNAYRYEKVDGKDICWMRDDSPYRFTFNPHIRKIKYPLNEAFPSDPYEWESRKMQDEAYFNEKYTYQSAFMTGDNWRHLGIYSEGGHYKPYYGERFFNTRGRNITNISEVINEFGKLTDNPLYLELFGRYLNDNGN